jgi:L-methionine (R)-S-oxide reductase
MIVLFGAKWCKNCAKLKASIEEQGITEYHDSVAVLKVDIDEVPEVADQFEVSALPHTAFIVRGHPTRHYVGSEIAKFNEYYAEVVASVVSAASSSSSAAADAAASNTIDTSSSSSSAAVDKSTQPDGLEPPVPNVKELPNGFRLPASRSFVFLPASANLTAHRSTAGLGRSEGSKVGNQLEEIPSMTFDLLSKLGLDSFRVSSQDVNAVIPDIDQTALSAANTEADQLVANKDLDNLRSLYEFKVPLLSLDGTCSVAHKLAKRPFNLATDAYQLPFEEEHLERLLSAPTTHRLLYLRHVVRQLNAVVQADWIGIYRMVEADGEPALLKEAYLGEHSRAVFPVTEAFAKKSTNSWVGLTGNVRIIEDTNVRESGVSYYECSNKVQSEICVPIYGAPSVSASIASSSSATESPVIGIIDLESWGLHHFTEAKVLQVIRTAFEVGASNFGFNHSR